ncbi:MAG: hypothetical protein ABJL67_02925 [Sulfitobacter sp.]
MRKQYHSRSVGSDTYIWDVDKLVTAAASLEVRRVPVTDVAEINENWWYQDDQMIPTPKAIAAHMRLVLEADLQYPIILCAQGRLMDGMHRVVKSLIQNKPDIRVVRFDVTPPHDFVNVALDSLPYPAGET